MRYLTKPRMRSLSAASLFSGCGGFDLGFKDYFTITYANDNDDVAVLNYRNNIGWIDDRDINGVCVKSLPRVDLIFGGPPCQSWSIAGKKEGFESANGRLMLKYIEIVLKQRPKMFVLENVLGLTYLNHRSALDKIVSLFEQEYHVSTAILNANDYDVAQTRRRFFIIGSLYDKEYKFPESGTMKLTQHDVIRNISGMSRPWYKYDRSPYNHERCVRKFSARYMCRSHIRGWDEPSHTIVASRGGIPLHPSSPPVIRLSREKYIFKEGFEHLYKRLSVRECARLQSFPDTYRFYYHSLEDGYRMIGNAVPVSLARYIAKSCYNYLLERV